MGLLRRIRFRIYSLAPTFNPAVLWRVAQDKSVQAILEDGMHIILWFMRYPKTDLLHASELGKSPSLCRQMVAHLSAPDLRTQNFT